MIRFAWFFLTIGFFDYSLRAGAIELSKGNWQGYETPKLKQAKGRNRLNGASPLQFDYYCLAYGSGLAGFESVEISNGTSLNIIVEQNEKWRAYSVTLKPAESGYLIQMFNSSLKPPLARQYLGLDRDGTQAILAAWRPTLHYRVWMSNCFHPNYTRLYDQVNAFLRKLPKNRFRRMPEPDPWAIQRHIY